MILAPEFWAHEFTHWVQVTHICVSDLTIIGSDNGLSPGRCQAIIRTNAGILLIRPWGTNFSEILIKILIFSFEKMHLKVSSAKRRPFCLGLNVLKVNLPNFVLLFRDFMAASRLKSLVGNLQNLSAESLVGTIDTTCCCCTSTGGENHRAMVS